MRQERTGRFVCSDCRRRLHNSTGPLLVALWDLSSKVQQNCIPICQLLLVRLHHNSYPADLIIVLVGTSGMKTALNVAHSGSAERFLKKEQFSKKSVL